MNDKQRMNDKPRMNDKQISKEWILDIKANRPQGDVSQGLIEINVIL